MRSLHKLFKGWLALMLAAATVAVSGCGFKDIDKRFFVVTVGVDKAKKEDKKYLVTLKLAVPSPQERFGSNQFILVSEEADSITEAVRIIKSKVDKELDFGQSKAIIFGEELLKESSDLDPLLDWFNRRRDIQLISWMMIGRPSAFSILQTKPISERLPSNLLFMFFGQAGTETAYIVSEYLFDFRRRQRERGLDPIMPIAEERSGDQLSINTTAVFNKNKWVLTLDPQETKYFNAFFSKIGKVDYKIEDENNYVLVATDNVRASFSVGDIYSDRPVLRAHVLITGLIEEAQKPAAIKSLEQLEKLGEKQINKKFTALLQKFQKANVDPVGFGLRFRAMHRTDEKEWKRWEEIYPNAKIEVTSTLKLKGTGVTK